MFFQLLNLDEIMIAICCKFLFRNFFNAHVAWFLVFIFLGVYQNANATEVPIAETDNQMIFHEYFVDLFKQEALPTEYTAYQLLKLSPLKIAVNYLVVPWSVLINSNQLHIVPRIKLSGGFTICQHIKFEQIIPLLKEIGIDTLFTPHAVKGKVYEGIVVVPFPHLPVNAPEAAETKDIWYSFIGFNTDWTRSQIFKMPHIAKVIIKERKKWHFWASPEQREVEANEYKNVLARSRFSLCPRGTGPSTPRFWESLKAGSIPVLIADDMALPNWIDWKSCIIRIPEKQVERIPYFLENISIQQEYEMRRSCKQCFEQFSGTNFVSVIREYYKN